MNTTKAVPMSSEMTDIVRTNLKEKQGEDLILETNSRKCSSIPFGISSLQSDSVQLGTNTISPLSVPEEENRNSCDSNEKGKEKNNSETLKTVEVEEDPLSPTLEVSHSVEGYLGNYKLIPMDIKWTEVFDGEYIRNNDGIYLDGKIMDDKVIYPLSQYDLSNGSIGNPFLHLLPKEIDEVRETKWNMEKVMCFMLMILQKSPDLKGVGNIKDRIKQRILEFGGKEIRSVKFEYYYLRRNLFES